MIVGMRKGSPKRASRTRSRPWRAALAALGRPSLAMVLLFTGLLLASAFVAIDIQRNALARHAAELHAQVSSAQATHTQLSADVAAKQTDDYVVNKARDYGYVLPGEALIGVQRDATPAPVSVTVQGPTRMQKWLALFFGAP